MLVSYPVQSGFDINRAQVLQRRYHRSDRTKGVERLCARELNVLPLQVPGRYVIYTRNPKDRRFGFFLAAQVSCVTSDDDTDLALEFDLRRNWWQDNRILMTNYC